MTKDIVETLGPPDDEFMEKVEPAVIIKLISSSAQEQKLIIELHLESKNGTMPGLISTNVRSHQQAQVILVSSDFNATHGLTITKF